MDKTCALCKVVKADAEFSPRQNKCKPCVALSAREKRHAQASQGLCACGQLPREGRRVCEKCLSEQRRRYAEIRSYDARMGDKYGPTDVQKRPGRWVEEPLRRTCKTCGVVKDITEFQEQNYHRNEGRSTRRHSCKTCESQKAATRVAASRQKGKCSRCGSRPPSTGYSTCAQCREYLIQSKSSLRAEVLVRYGAKCKHCGDPRLGCLTFDHVGGWGKDHKTTAGGRVSHYSLWKWARDNGYPSTIRLLCGSCHAHLSAWGNLPTELPTFARTTSGGDKLE